MTSIKQYLAEAMTPGDRKRLDAGFAAQTYQPRTAKLAGGIKYRAPGGDHGKKSAHHYVSHEGKEYSYTGKRGTHIKSGEPSYEYSHRDDNSESRVWVTKSGKVHQD